MVLLRVRDEDGVVGLGEAVPLSLRGGAELSRWCRNWRGGRRRQATEGFSAPARCAVETALMDLRGRRAAGSAPASSANRSGPVQRDARRRRSGAGGGAGAQVGGGRFHHLQAQARRRVRKSRQIGELFADSRRGPGAGRCGRRWGRGADSGRRERGLGTGDREAHAGGAGAAGDRAGGAAGGGAGGDGGAGRVHLDPPRGGRERGYARGGGAGRGARGLRVHRDQALQGRRAAGGAAGSPTSSPPT